MSWPRLVPQTREDITVSSTWQGILIYTGLAILLPLVFTATLVLAVALVGRLSGVVVMAAGTSWKLIASRTWRINLRRDWRPLATIAVGAVLVALWLADWWIVPLRWEVGAGKLWWALSAKSGSLPMWLLWARFIVALALPAAAYKATAYAVWAFYAEIVWPKLREAGFSTASTASAPAPRGWEVLDEKSTPPSPGDSVGGELLTPLAPPSTKWN